MPEVMGSQVGTGMSHGALPRLLMDAPGIIV